MSIQIVALEGQPYHTFNSNQLLNTCSTGVGDQNYSPETGRSFPLGGSPKNATGSNYPSGQTGTDPTGDTIGTSSRGPHSSSLANKADPRVDSDLDSSRQIGSTGLGSGTGPISSSTHQGTLGRDPALISGTGVEHDMTSGTGTAPQAGIGSGIAAGAALGGAESWEHDHNRHGHRYEGDPCATGEAAPTGALHTHGPHVTDTANRLDPHVAADGTSTSHHHGDHGHHHGDIASTGGLAAASHETSRATSGTVAGTSNGSKFDHSNPGTVGTSSTGKTAGPHKSDLLNKLDPRVDSDLSKQQGRTDTIDRGSDSSSHKYGRDAGLVGAGGAAAFAAEKHHHHSEPQVRNTALDHSYPHSSFGVDPPVGSTSSGYGKTVDFDDTRKDHHLGRDVALGEGAGGTAYAAEHTHAKPTQASTVPGDMAGTVHENTTGQTGSGHHSASAALAGSGHQATTGYAESGHPQTSSHHLGRDATFGAGAGGAAYEADKMINTDRTEPGTQVREHTHPGASIATYPSPGYGNEGAFDPSEGRAHHHRKEDAAIAGGAGVGIGAAADHKFSREDHKDSAKEHNKEQKAIAKEHHREEKALAKEHHNEEKAHEKEQAKHERIIEKEEKKHEKSLEKEAKKEDRSEKKHGGILGLFHRDKGDKNNREDLMQGHASSRAREDGRDLNEQMTTAPRRGPLEGEHGTQSGVHDPPLDTGIGSGVGSGTGIGHGITTHDAYGTQEGQNKLHKVSLDGFCEEQTPNR